MKWKYSSHCSHLNFHIKLYSSWFRICRNQSRANQKSRCCSRLHQCLILDQQTCKTQVMYACACSSKRQHNRTYKWILKCFDVQQTVVFFVSEFLRLSLHSKGKPGIKAQLFCDEEITWRAWMESYSPLKVWAGSREQSRVSVPPLSFYSHTHCSAVSVQRDTLDCVCVCGGIFWLQPQAFLDDYEPNCHQWRTTIRHTTGDLPPLIHTFFKGHWPLRKDRPGFISLCKWHWTFMYRMSAFIKWGDGQGVQTLCRDSNRWVVLSFHTY